MAERSFTILMTTSTAVPVKNRKALFCAVARYFPVYPIWSARFAFKGRLRGANKAEAQVVVAVVRVVVVPVADRRVVGVVVPGATTFDAVRTRRRAEPCRFLQENTVLIFSFFFAERMLQPSRSRYRCFACMAYAFFLHPYRVTARSEQGGSPSCGCGGTGSCCSGSRQTRCWRCCSRSHHVGRG